MSELTCTSSYVVGEGTFGSCSWAVYRGNIPVLLKKIKEGGKSELIREARALQLLRHESIPLLFGVNTDHDENLLVTQFCGYKGEDDNWKSMTVERALRRKVLADAMQWIQPTVEMVETFQFIHSKGDVWQFS